MTNGNLIEDKKKTVDKIKKKQNKKMEGPSEGWTEWDHVPLLMSKAGKFLTT